MVRLQALRGPAALLASLAVVATGALAGGTAAGAASVRPLTILVTNDDGYNSSGIDTLVQSLPHLAQGDGESRRPGHQREWLG